MSIFHLHGFEQETFLDNSTTLCFYQLSSLLCPKREHKLVFLHVNEKKNTSVSLGKAEKHEMLKSLESIKLAKYIGKKTADMENNHIKIPCFTEMKFFRVNGEQKVNLEKF